MTDVTQHLGTLVCLPLSLSLSPAVNPSGGCCTTDRPLRCRGLRARAGRAQLCTAWAKAGKRGRHRGCVVDHALRTLPGSARSALEHLQLIPVASSTDSPGLSSQSSLLLLKPCHGHPVQFGFFLHRAFSLLCVHEFIPDVFLLGDQGCVEAQRWELMLPLSRLSKKWLSGSF